MIQNYMIESYITRQTVFPTEAEEPWRIIENLCENIHQLIELLDDEYVVKDGVAIHHSATIGHDVNIEAGAILCNHYNEREDDTVYVHVGGQRIFTGLHKFGSLVGDGCRIGANAVLSPGTLLMPNTIVRRLELIEQDPL